MALGPPRQKRRPGRTHTERRLGMNLLMLAPSHAQAVRA